LSAQAQKITGETNNQFKGITVQDITPATRKDFHLPRGLKGVVVTDITDDSPAADSFAPGDVIMEINRQKIGNVGDYTKVVSKIKAGEESLVLILRNGLDIYYTF